MRTKRALEVKLKAFFIIFKGLSIAKNCLRPEIAPFSMVVEMLEKEFLGDIKI